MKDIPGSRPRVEITSWALCFLNDLVHSCRNQGKVPMSSIKREIRHADYTRTARPRQNYLAWD